MLQTLGTIASVVVVGWLFVDRLTGQQMRQPLTWDELGTVETYTWAAFHANGVPRRITRADEVKDLPRPTPIQLVAGLYRAVAVWREPNDHIPHSVLVNLSLLARPGSERSARVPAWLGALVFALAVAWFARRTGHAFAWPLALVLAAGWPYVHEYAIEARGYTWMLALQVVLLLALYRLAGRPASVAWGGLCALIAVLSFWNIVSLSLDWLLPAYAALWLSPPFRADPAVTPTALASRRYAYRTNLLVQGLAVGFVGLVFVMDHLPYVLVSLQEFGLPTAPGEFPGRVVEMVRYLLPNARWMTIGVAGAWGWILMTRRPATRPLGLACLLTLLVSAVHFLLARKFPYARTCGYFLPLLILGVTHVVERLLDSRPERQRAWLQLAVLAGAGALVISQHLELREQGSVLARFRGDLRARPVSGRPYATAGLRDAWIRYQHLPANYLNAFDSLDLVAEATQLGFLTRPNDDPTPRLGAARWPVVPAGDMQLRMVPAAASRVLGAPPPRQYPVVVLWVLAPDRPELRNELLHEVLRSLETRWQKFNRQVFNKLEFSNQVYSVEFAVQNPAEYAQVKGAIERAKPTLGGDAVVIEPTGP